MLVSSLLTLLRRPLQLESDSVCSDYPVTGNPNEEVRSYKRVDDRTLDFAGKKSGKAMASGRVVVAADGKSRTVTTTVTDPSGKKVTNVAVYDKQ